MDDKVVMSSGYFWCQEGRENRSTLTKFMFDGSIGTYSAKLRLFGIQSPQKRKDRP